MSESRPSTVAETQPFSRIPRATYRVQLRKEFGFADVEQLLDYLHQLGISDVYLSPLFRAREDSSHGYDVVNHAKVASEFGGREAFDSLAERAKKYGMGILLDIVPNHMGVNDRSNIWWNDVLCNGPYSRYADFFDIDWNRTATGLNQRVLLPVLGEPFGATLEGGQLKLAYDSGEFWVSYGHSHYPVSPLTWPMILNVAIEYLHQFTNPKNGLSEGDSSTELSALWELESIATQCSNLSDQGVGTAAALNVPRQLDDQRIAKRYQEQAIAQRRLQQLLLNSTWVNHAIKVAIGRFNNERSTSASDSPMIALQASGGGESGADGTWDLLERLLDAQWYRLAYWRVAADEINYRRFFDINDLAAIRVELPQVFAEVHALVGELLQKGQITGLRIDHVDGLLDPGQYLEDLQKLNRRALDAAASDSGDIAKVDRGDLYVVVEKILSADEELPKHWRIAGATGYELLVQLNLLQVSTAGLAELRSNYRRLTGVSDSPRDVVYRSKLRIIDSAMSSELHMLASQLVRLSQQLRWARDFSFGGLYRSLREIVACFPVYRTYVRSRGWEASHEDHAVVMQAIRMAKLRNPTMEWSAFDFIGKILLLHFPPGVSSELQDALRAFVLRFQQVTGPITAKGTEDTAGYRYFPLASLNEVGSELESSPLEVDEFHRLMLRRASDWPHALSTTSTHDTKRGEDVRARLNAITEFAPEVIQHLSDWMELNATLQQTVGHELVPGRNEQYLLYQTLLGTWPTTKHEPHLSEDYWQAYRDRIREYMLKAVREAKQHTSWANPAADYERAVEDFVTGVLDRNRSQMFIASVHELANKIANAGFLNGLTQVLLKMTVPGVPDFYQGSEVWDFRLVDPDNRRQVDFVRHTEGLASLVHQFQNDPGQTKDGLWRDWPAENIKQFLIWRVLHCRSSAKSAFDSRDYLPLTVEGKLQKHVVAFIRSAADCSVLVVATLQALGLVGNRSDEDAHVPPQIDWGDTTLRVPQNVPRVWQDQLSDRCLEISAGSSFGPRIAVAELLGSWTVGCWMSHEKREA